MYEHIILLEELCLCVYKNYQHARVEYDFLSVFCILLRFLRGNI